MLHLTEKTPILLALKPVDFRKQIDGLVALCEQHLEEEPSCGRLFVFINRSKTMIRVLCYEENGYWLATKRLSKGRYKLVLSTYSFRSLQQLMGLKSIFLITCKHDKRGHVERRRRVDRCFLKRMYATKNPTLLR